MQEKLILKPFPCVSIWWRESRFWNPGNPFLWNPNPGLWNPESKLHWHRIRNSVPGIQICTEWNPESKTQDNCLGFPYMGQPVWLCFVILAAPALFEMTVEKYKRSWNWVHEIWNCWNYRSIHTTIKSLICFDFVQDKRFCLQLSEKNGKCKLVTLSEYALILCRYLELADKKVGFSKIV